MSGAYIPVNSGGTLIPVSLPGYFGGEYFSRQCRTLYSGFVAGIRPKELPAGNGLPKRYARVHFINGEWVREELIPDSYWTTTGIDKNATGFVLAETDQYVRIEVAQEASAGSSGAPTVVERTLQVGWDAGAISIPTIKGDGGYQFSVPTSTVGVVIGLADNYTGAGYLSIQHALEFNRGSVSVVNRGREVVDLGPYSSLDVFKIVRTGSSVHYYQNDIHRYTESFAIGNEFYLAAATYMEGDTVEGAKVVAVNAGVGSGTATIGPLLSDGLGGFEAQSFGLGKFGPLSATGGALARGSGVAQLGPLSAFGGEGARGAGFGGVGPLGSIAEGGLATPSWGVGVSTFGPLFSGGRILSGQIIDGIATLDGIQAIGSDRAMGQGRGVVGKVAAFGSYYAKLSHGFLRHQGGYDVSGSGSQGDIQGAQLRLPAIELEGRFGLRGEMRTPKVALSATMTIVRTLQMNLGSPSLSVEGRGVTGGVGRAQLTHAGRYRTNGHSGAQASLALQDRYKVEAVGATGSAGEAALHFVGRYTLVADGRAQQATVWSLSAPSLQVVPSGQAWLVAPAITMVAAGGEIVEASYEAYSINLATGAVTRYTDFAFDNVLRFGDKFFGVRADGVYELAGDTDDGAPIVAQVRTFNTNFGATNIKRVPFMYVSGQVGTDLKVGFVADKGVEYKYPVGLVREQGVHTGRAKAGLGVKGSYYNFSITNEDGQDFQIDRLEAIVDATTVVKA